MNNAVNVVLFEGGSPAGEIEKMLVRVRHAVLLDNIVKMKQLKEIGALYLLTNYSLLAEEAEAMGAKIIKTENGDSFHFGKALSELINRERLQNVLYMGGASIPLVTADELQEICRRLLNSEAVIYSNNAQSADIVAFTPGELINKIDPPRIDNILAVSLRDGTGVVHKLFRNSAGLTFDLDTPADLLILAGSPFAGQRARKVLEKEDLDLSRLERAKEVLRGDYEEVLLLGRVGAPIIAHINQNLKLRLRVFSEERGMKALGREEKGNAISLMGYFLEEVGHVKFMKYLEKVARCAFLDTRVLMIHLLHGRLSTEERFLSDLGLWQEMKNPVMRDFTRAAVEAEIPVICGGHSLVLGGLWALVDEIGPTHNFGQVYQL
ncbi:MAG TPA: hypothetical protein GX004_06680 [Firmicutes bacterium]|jgi:hypothetical protein|nr:hypothetical protein [Bacillota bacterium]